MATGFRTQGAPSVIQSNVVGAGLVEGDQLGDQLPGVLQSLQEGPEASKTSTLYYNENVGQFNQPSFQRSFGAFNLNIPIQKFGDSGSVEVNPDIYWKGPCIVSTVFTIPYAYYGPNVYRPTNQKFDYMNSAVSFVYGDRHGGGDQGYYDQYSSSCTVRPKMFYSWGAAYAAIRETRLNMGGAMSYVLDHYANFVGVMASCYSMTQRAGLMRAAGCGVMIPDFVNELKYGLTHETGELGMIPLYAADGGALSFDASNENYTSNGYTGQTGCTSICGPANERWSMAIKTPHTNFQNMFQHRRPIDTRLFSSNFVMDFFSQRSLDTFIDSGLGYQPMLARKPVINNGVISAPFNGLNIIQAYNSCCYKLTDGLFPSMTYRQLQLPNYSAIVGAEVADQDRFALINADVRAAATDIPSASNAALYRRAQLVDWQFIALSKGYHDLAGDNPASGSGNTYLSQDSLPQPTMTSIISASRLANDQLGARQILETRGDLCVYYPFQHFVSQVYRVNQLTDATGNIPYNPNAAISQLTPFVNTTSGGQGFGGVSIQNMKNFNSPPISYQNPLNVAISIPFNPLTVMYIMVMREKDRMGLGWSTPNSYSPALYWNALELQAFNLTYSSQILQKYESLDQYFLQQLHERCEPLVVPFRGGPVVRSDLPLKDPSVIQNYPGYPGAWYNSYIYEFPMVDQLPLRNEAFFQQTPGFRGEMLNFNFWIKPSIRPWSPLDFDFRRATGLPDGYTDFNLIGPGTATDDTYIQNWHIYVERLANWCPGIPQTACAESNSINWNLNNDNLLVVCVFAQNALWQLSPLNCKIVFARGA